MTEQVDTHTCPNCGSEHSASYMFCPQCGQKNQKSILTFREMALDLLSSNFSFDTRAVRSLPLLLFHPGTLTREYLLGRRETYLAPFRLYIFLSLVLFLLVPLVVTDDALFSPESMNFNELLTDSTAVVNDTGRNESGSNSYSEEIMADSILTGNAVADSILNKIRGGSDMNISFKRKEPDEPVVRLIGGDSIEGSRWNQAVTLVESGYSVEQAADSIFPDISRRNKFLARQGLKLQSQRGRGLTSSFLDVTSYALFLFLPFFALWLKLLYVRRKRFYVEHLIFSLHFFSFFFFLTIVYILVHRFLFHFTFGYVCIAGVVYLYAAMYRFYGQSLARTFLKWFVLLLSTSVFILPVFFLIALAISLIFY